MGFGIGNDNNELLFDLPKDKQHFKSITSGKIVVMGRKTWDSLPKKPLEKRKNYVLTHDKTFSPNGAKVINSIEEVIKLGKSHDIYIIGGGELYKQTIEYADTLIITHVHTFKFDARVFFPDISFEEWKVEKMEKHEPDDLHPSFTFATYVRQK